MKREISSWFFVFSFFGFLAFQCSSNSGTQPDEIATELNPCSGSDTSQCTISFFRAEEEGVPSSEITYKESLRSPEDVHYYKTSMQAGQTYAISIMDDPEQDPYVFLEISLRQGDANGPKVIDITHPYTTGFVYTAPENAEYYVEVRTYEQGFNIVSPFGSYLLMAQRISNDCSANREDSNCVMGSDSELELEWEAFRDIDWIKLENLDADKNYYVHFNEEREGGGYSSPGLTLKLFQEDGTLPLIEEESRARGIAFTTPASGDYFLKVERANSNIRRARYTVTTSRGYVDSCGQTADTACSLSLDISSTDDGIIDNPGNDRDWYAVSLEAGKTYRLAFIDSVVDLSWPHSSVSFVCANDAGSIECLNENYTLFSWLSHQEGSSEYSLDIRAGYTGTFYVVVSDIFNLYTVLNYGSISVSEIPADSEVPLLESAPDDPCGEDIASSCALSIGVDYEGDGFLFGYSLIGSDNYQVELEQSKTYRVSLKGPYTEDEKLLLSSVYLAFLCTEDNDPCAANGGQSATSHSISDFEEVTESGSTVSYSFEFTAAATGTYYLSLWSSNLERSLINYKTINISEVSDSP